MLEPVDYLDSKLRVPRDLIGWNFCCTDIQVQVRGESMDIHRSIRPEFGEVIHHVSGSKDSDRSLIRQIELYFENKFLRTRKRQRFLRRWRIGQNFRKDLLNVRYGKLRIRGFCL